MREEITTLATDIQEELTKLQIVILYGSEEELMSFEGYSIIASKSQELLALVTQTPES